MTDPNVTTTDDGEEVVLEPGDPGYVDPDVEPDEPTVLNVELPVAPPQDLQFVREPGETDAEFAARTHGAVVVSENATDVVPNMPQITMGSQEPAEDEPVVTVATVEGGPEAAPEEDDDEDDEDEPPERKTAAELIEQAEAATTNEELDQIEAQADERVTVLNAVEKRRSELGDR